MRPPPVAASCTGKDRLTAQQAREIARRIRTRAAHAYRCDYCGYWHVGSHLVRSFDKRGGGR